MIEYECPECQEPMESPERYCGSKVECPNCGSRVVVPRGSVRFGAERAEYNTAASTNPGGSVASVVIAVWMVVCYLVCYFGGLALHIWTAYLFYENWGTFAGIVAFLVPFGSEALALITCFWWGVWFYVLAVLAWLAAAVSLLILGACEEKGESAIIKVCVAIVGVIVMAIGSFAYFAVGHARAPRPMTADVRAELDDLSYAVCAALNASLSDDPVASADLAEAKAKLRKRLKKCDGASKVEICRGVNSYLRAMYLLEQDIEAYARGNKEEAFSLSPRTCEAMDTLPPMMKAQVGPKDLQSIEKTFAEDTARWGRFNVEKFRLVVEQHWWIRRQVYEDLLDTPMPSPGELRGSE